jgi:dTDP-4-dehydrorhamnose reductase
LDWCKAILRLDPLREQQVARQILPASTRDFPTPAQRPLFSALDCDLFSRTFGLRLPDWEQALQLAMFAGDTQPTP